MKQKEYRKLCDALSETYMDNLCDRIVATTGNPTWTKEFFESPKNAVYQIIIETLADLMENGNLIAVRRTEDNEKENDN